MNNFIEHHFETEYDMSNKTYIKRKSKLMVKGVCWGKFTIDGHPFNNDYYKLQQEYPYTLIYPNTMTIKIGGPFKGRGFVRSLIQEMIEKIKEYEPKIRENQYLFVETDISNGFWDYIGMSNVPMNVSVDDQGYGHAKYFTFSDLKRFAYSIPVFEE